jgi:hypothetical protein
MTYEPIRICQNCSKNDFKRSVQFSREKIDSHLLAKTVCDNCNFVVEQSFCDPKLEARFLKFSFSEKFEQTKNWVVDTLNKGLKLGGVSTEQGG